MKRYQLGTRFIVMLLTLVIFVSVAMQIINWLGSANLAQKQLTSALQVGTEVFKRSYSDREQTLLTAAQVLTNDFGFKRAVALNDAPTIASALGNHGRRINATLMGLLDLNGNLQTVTNSNDQIIVTDSSSTPLIDVESVFKNGYSATVISLNGQLYQSIFVTISAPNPIAIAWVGFSIDASLLSRLAQITSLEVTVKHIGNEASNVSISSLVNETRINNITGGSLPTWAVLFASAEDYVSRVIDLDASGKTQIILSASVNDLVQEFRKTTIQSIGISIAGVILAIVFGIAMTKKTVLPLVCLRDLANKIAQGNYHSKIEAKTRTTELVDLANSFALMQTNVQEREEKIRYQAEHDVRTGLYNRDRILEVIRERINKDERFQIVSFCVNEFREINETFGFVIGDRCVQALANELQSYDGIPARVSGGEFVWIPNSNHSIEQIEHLAAAMRQALRREEMELNINISCGVAFCPDDATEAGDLIRRLGIAAHHAQIANVVVGVYHQEQERNYLQRLEILHELGRLLSSERSELSMHYQPKMNASNGTCSRFEALIRWHSTSMGFVSPELFIPIAERAGIIGDITEWVIKRVINDIKSWQLENIKVAINVSVHDLTSPTLLDSILANLATAGLPTSALAFEVTESGVMEETEQAVSELKRWKAAGFSLAIDDFGTGQASLAYVKTLPVDELKIDKSFVLSLASDPDDQTIVHAIIDLASKFGLEVVAEGVEDEASLAILKNWGCQWIQGYFISRPLPADHVCNWLDNFHSTKLESA